MPDAAPGPPLPPANLECEQCILGCLIADYPSADEPTRPLRIDELYNDQHRTILRAIRTVAKNSQPDYLTICAELQAMGKLDDVGGTAYVAQLTDTPPGFTPANLRHWVAIVKRCAAKRKLIEATGRTWDRLRHSAPDDDVFARAADTLADLLDAQRAVLQPEDADVEPLTAADVRRIQGATVWAWDKWLPCGHLTMFAGEQGNMKSALALRIAACFTEGWPWPDGSTYAGELGKALWLEAESAHGVTSDRAEAWGMDLSRIIFASDSRRGPEDALLDVNLDNADHKRVVAGLANDPAVRVIILDSLSAAASARDENSSGMLEITRWLSSLARTRKLPVILVHHLRKKGLFDTSVVTMERLRGSSAIGQLARSVWACDRPDGENADRRLYVIKSNLCAMPADQYGLRMSDTGMVFVDAPQEPQTPGARDLAGEFLRDFLARGPQPASAVYDAAKAHGISDRTLKRAKESLHVASFRRFGEPGWFWALPADIDRTPPEEN